MAKMERVLFVCKCCGAVGTTKQMHCIFCGASLDKTMQIVTGKRMDRTAAAPKGRTDKERKKITALSLLSAIFGGLSVLFLGIHFGDSGFLFGMTALILSVVALCQRRGGTIPAVLGIVLGVYTMFVNLFWFFLQFFFMF